MYTKMCVRLALAAAAFSFPAALPAMAADDCKTSVTAAGKPAKMRDLGAYPNSLFAWRSAVKERHGSEYNSWRYAQDKTVDCVEKGGEWVCTRTAKPCIDVLHSLTGKAKEAVAKKDCKSEEVSSYGARKKTRKEAEEQSIFGWEIDVRKKHGKDWAVWRSATGTDIDCRDVKEGFQCIAVGTACMPKA